jgi:transcription-repair coupling factor (superfamily II helicase)
VNKLVPPFGLFGQAVRRLSEGGALTLASAPEGFDAFVVADIARGLAKAGEERAVALCFVARDGQRAQSFIDALAFAAPEIEALYLPSWDCQPYDRVSPNAAISAHDRLGATCPHARRAGAPAHSCHHGQCAGAARSAPDLRRRRRFFRRARQ